jgi:SAM-dependent methyltransferase/pimeloyl-ACP methyl ester carboxylesterase
MDTSLATSSCRATAHVPPAAARVLVAAARTGFRSCLFDDLHRQGMAQVVDDVAAAIEILAMGGTWVLVAEAGPGPFSGIDLVRMALGQDPDLAAVVLYERAALPEVVRAVRDGTSARFLRKDADIQALRKLVLGLLEVRHAEEARREDRRAFPRVLPPDVTILEPPGAVLVDVTPSGLAFIQEGADVPSGFFRLALRLATRSRLDLEAEVVRSNRDGLGRWTVAARFVEPPPRVVKALQTIVRRHLVAQGPREMQRRFRESASSDVVPISARDHVGKLLTRAVEQRALASIQAASGALQWRASIRTVDLSAGRFEVDAPATVAAVAPGQVLDFLLQLEFESYLFEGRLVVAEVPRLVCEFPGLVYYSEKRSRTRLVIAPEDEVKVLVPHPRGSGPNLEFPLLDISSTGMSFAANLDRYVILPGTVIEPIRIGFHDKVVVEERAEVRHVTSLGGESLFKVGVHHAPSRRPSSSPVQIPAPSAAHRTYRPSDSPARAAKLVKFLNADEEEVVGLLNVTSRQPGAAGPVVVIAPSWGFSKESFSAYSLCLAEAFERAGQPGAVLRFDYTHHKGESYIPERNRLPGREAVDFTLSHAVSDILAAVDFCFSNPIFSPTAVVLVGPSFSGPIALRAARQDPRVGHLVFPMGTPSTQELVKNASGGLDYFGAHTHGVRAGVVDFLGLLLDMDAGVADAIRHHLAFPEDAKADLAVVDASVDWIAGRFDAWVDPVHVEALLERGDPARTQLSLLDVGHLPTHEEGMVVAVEVVRSVFRRLGIDGGNVLLSSKEDLESLQAQEWGRAPRVRLDDTKGYWRGYLLGKAQTSLGFDVLGLSREYQSLLQAQCEMLDLEGVEDLLDAGAGTGQFLAHLLGVWRGPLPRRIDAVDLVPEALERAERRISTASRRAETTCRFRRVDLQTSRLLPVQRFLAGEYHRIGCLRDRIAGLKEEWLVGLESAYSEPTGALVHMACRGVPVAQSELELLEPDLRAVVCELGRAARLVMGTLLESDLRPEAAASVRTLRTAGRPSRFARANEVRFECLDFGDSGAPAPLDLSEEAYDRILLGLVLPYLLNPDETLRELVRALRPGGRIVASTLKADVDLSRLQEDLVRRVEAGEVAPPEGTTKEWLLEELRAYTGMAAFLLRLTQERTFRFFDAREFAALMEGAGLRDLEVRSSFGEPPQAFVIAGRKP